jgi:hypothetical protein
MVRSERETTWTAAAEVLHVLVGYFHPVNLYKNGLPVICRDLPGLCRDLPRRTGQVNMLGPALVVSRLNRKSEGGVSAVELQMTRDRAASAVMFPNTPKSSTPVAACATSPFFGSTCYLYLFVFVHCIIRKRRGRVE